MLTGYPRKMNFIFQAVFVAHQNFWQVFISIRKQLFIELKTVKLMQFPLMNFEITVFHDSIISDFGMKHYQAFLSPFVAGGKY